MLGRLRVEGLVWGLLCLLSWVGAQQYDFRQGFPEMERPRRVEQGGRVAGALKSGFISVVGGYIFGHVYYKLKARGIVSSYKKKLDKLKKAYDTKNEQLRLEFGSTIQSLDIHADAVDGMIQQLEQILQHPDTDPSKRKLAEFKMPDSNNDNLISRQEFNTYLKSYFAAHPELREMEFPTFDDFDMDHNGLVSFPEWKEFVANLEKEQEKAEAEAKKKAPPSIKR